MPSCLAMVEQLWVIAVACIFDGMASGHAGVGASLSVGVHCGHRNPLPYRSLKWARDQTNGSAGSGDECL